MAGGGDWSDIATHCRGGGEGEQCQQQRRLTKLGHGAGKERGKEERERVEGAGRVLGFSFPKMTREGRGADTRRHAAAAHYHGGARWRAAGAPRAMWRCAPVHGRP